MYRIENQEIEEASIVNKIDSQSSYGIRFLVGYVRVVDTVSFCPSPFERTCVSTTVLSGEC
jgi:hypothetical protein